MRSKCYDLHNHTIASDGELTPTELIQRAITNHVDVLAITDHDSVMGLTEAATYIDKNKLPIRLINGVEISTAWNHQDIHIIGLNIDPENKRFRVLLEDQKKYRIERAKKMGERLSKLGIKDAYIKIKRYVPGDIVTRAHFARYLVDENIVKNVSAGFKHYLSKGKKAYVAPNWCSMATAVQVIKEAGGQAVLAHPMRYNLTRMKLIALLLEFKQTGGEAIEISHCRQTDKERAQLEQYTQKYQFLGSQGSDFHRLNSYLDIGRITPFSSCIIPVWHNWSI